jgi:hypothetical protein
MLTRRLPAVAVLLLSGLALATRAEAAAPTKKKVVNAEVIAQLKSARALMHKANHNYKGHRAKAMHQTTQAIHALGGGGKKKDPAAPPKVTPPTGKRTPEAQAISDAQLRQAQTDLKAILTTLNSLPAGAGRAKAINHIKKAIADLDTALKVA